MTLRLPAMKTLTCIPQDYSIPDPPLSVLGFKQCEELGAQLQDFDLAQRIELIIVSPMRRTLQTAEASLRWLIDRGIPVQLRGEWQGWCPTSWRLDAFLRDPIFKDCLD